MRNLREQARQRIKNLGEGIGVFFLILGVLVLFTYIAFSLTIRRETDLLGISLGLLSVGLGFIAIGLSAKSDKKHTELLEKLGTDVERLPTLFKNDILTITGQQLAESVIVKEGRRGYADVIGRFVLKTEEQSKEAAQKRLDEDTKKVGYVRGELYQTKDGNWAINWKVNVGEAIVISDWVKGEVVPNVPKENSNQNPNKLTK